jgi:hypothetical protein
MSMSGMLEMSRKKPGTVRVVLENVTPPMELLDVDDPRIRPVADMERSVLNRVTPPIWLLVLAVPRKFPAMWVPELLIVPPLMSNCVAVGAFRTIGASRSPVADMERSELKNVMPPMELLVAGAPRIRPVGARQTSFAKSVTPPIQLLAVDDPRIRPVADMQRSRLNNVTPPIWLLAETAEETNAPDDEMSLTRSCWRETSPLDVRRITSRDPTATPSCWLTSARFVMTGR